MSIFKIADLSHLGFYGSNNGFFEKPNYISSSTDTIALNCLVFEKIAFFCHFGERPTNRQTDEQMASTDALSRSRCRERRLNDEDDDDDDDDDDSDGYNGGGGVEK